MWEVLEFCILAIIVLTVVTQVIIPAFSNIPFFWLFTRSTARLLEADAKLRDVELKNKARELEEEALDDELQGLGIPIEGEKEPAEKEEGGQGKVKHRTKGRQEV